MLTVLYFSEIYFDGDNLLNWIRLLSIADYRDNLKGWNVLLKWILYISDILMSLQINSVIVQDVLIGIS